MPSGLPLLPIALAPALSLATVLMTFSGSAVAAPFELRAEVTRDGQAANGQYDLRLLLDRGLPGLTQVVELGPWPVVDGHLIAPVTLDDRLLDRATQIELQARPAGAKGAFSSLATVAAKGICSLSPWTLTGNADATEQSFLGTTNQQPLRLRAQNSAVGSLDYHVESIGPNTQESVNVLFGWPGNSIGSNAWGNVVMGGGRRLSQARPNAVDDGAWFTTISGGYGNRTTASAASIGGGNDNRAAANATVAGGTENLATSPNSSIGGGARNAAEGNFSVVAGGDTNFAGAYWSAIPGGLSNRATGVLSLAAGAFADALHDGSYVWSQSDGSYRFGSSANDQVLFQARGGFGINGSAGPIPGTPLNAELTVRTSGNPDNNTDLMLLNNESSASNFRGFSLASVPNGQFYITSLYNNGGTLRYDALLGLLATSSGNAAVSVNRGGTMPQLGAIVQIGDGGNDGNGAYLTTGGTWTNASSQTFKTGFLAIDPEQVLDRLIALPLTTWRYRQSEEGRHLGPTAEAFAAAFRLGNDSKHISTVDADGVSMAAIQGLNLRLQREKAELLERIEKLELRLSQLDARAP